MVLAPCWAWPASSGPTAPKDEKDLAEAFRGFAKREAATYTIRLEGSDRPLTLRPEPVLTWSNPVMGTIYGDVFVWTADGRPEAVASIYRFYSPDPHRADEFHSLALGKLIAERDGVTVWTPSRPRVGVEADPRRPVPADSAAARLRQMRPWRRSSPAARPTAQGVDSDMRLLAQPIYRYENTKGDLIDGGLFVFVQGTDPEVFLLIEARRPPRGAPEWRFGATRMHGIDLRVIAAGKWSGMPRRSPRNEPSGGRTRSSVSRPRRVGSDPQRSRSSSRCSANQVTPRTVFTSVDESSACPTLTFQLLRTAPLAYRPPPTLRERRSKCRDSALRRCATS